MAALGCEFIELVYLRIGEEETASFLGSSGALRFYLTGKQASVISVP